MKRDARDDDGGGSDDTSTPATATTTAPDNQSRKRPRASSTAAADGAVANAAVPPPRRHPKPSAVRMMAKCPSCEANVKVGNAIKHLRACCSEHLRAPEAAAKVPAAEAAAASAAAAAEADEKQQQHTVPEPLRDLLTIIAAQEAEQRKRVLKITFMVDEEEEEEGAAAAADATTTTTTSRRRPLPDVARIMALPERRVSKLLERAMRTLEMPRDPDPSLVVLHECGRFLAVAKPAGVPTTPAHRWRGGSMLNRLLWHAEKGAEAGNPSYEPRVLHRLDLDTSGVLLCSKDARAAAAGQAAMTGGRGGRGGAGGEKTKHATKSYLALAYGWPPPWWTERGEPAAAPLPPGVRVVGESEGDGEQEQPQRGLLAFEVDAAIGRHPDSTVGRRVAADGAPFFGAAAGEGEQEEEEEAARDGAAPEPKFLPASTRFVVLAAAPGPPPPPSAGRQQPSPLACAASREATLTTFGGESGASKRAACLVLATLRTGRTHQIRLHLAHAGLPIAGDELYGAPLRHLIPRQALHAWRLAIECQVPPPQSQPRRAPADGDDDAEPADDALRLDLRAPLPEDMLRAAKALGVPVPAWARR
jgi:23S rRNA-/tRNA-specific pseudouridylate synthase